MEHAGKLADHICHSGSVAFQGHFQKAKRATMVEVDAFISPMAAFQSLHERTGDCGLRGT